MKTYEDHVVQIVVSAWLIHHSGLPDSTVGSRISMMISHMAKELNVDEAGLMLEYLCVAQLLINCEVFETKEAKTLIETVKASPQTEKVEEAVMGFIAFVKELASQHGSV